MAREGTRSTTGNSKPRVFPVVDTAPAVTRKKSTKPKTKKTTTVKGAKPAGVTKKTAPKKEGGVAKKVRAAHVNITGAGPLALTLHAPLCRLCDWQALPVSGHACALPITCSNILPQVKSAVKKAEKKVDKDVKKVEKVC